MGEVRIALTEDDRARLVSARRGGWFVLAACAVVNLPTMLMVREAPSFGVPVAALFATATLVPAFVVLAGFRAISLDLAAGEKLRVTGVIERKYIKEAPRTRSSSGSQQWRYLDVEGQAHEVDAAVWERAQVGADVTIEVAPLSRVTLGVAL